MNDKVSPAHPLSDEDSPSVEMVDHSSDSSGSEDHDQRNKGGKDQATSATRNLSCDGNKNPFGLVPCIWAGIAVKRSPFRVDSWVDTALTLDGRDKITKFVQYSARLLAWYYMRDAAQRERFESLKKTMTSSRKAYRLGRTFIELHRLKLQQQAKKSALNSGFGNLVEKLAKDIRLIGLAGFWAMDNTSFLAAAGLWDNWKLDAKERARQRQFLSKRASELANQSYFASSVAGFWVNVRAVLAFRKANLLKQNNDDDEATTKKLQAKYFGLCVALLKSVCDILVFSNNPGIDLWQKHSGSKMNELVHCLCGLTSASVVLYKNYPDASS
uniref:Peroxisomal biogenesis factor 11 n=1 Tax=Amphora coffeiformis TaxID=265554 RepID=A0A7S3PDJ1_9STRA|eukprot:scaffold1223_cov151-Amphora_coffeaeformis.AAC.1